jgi:hypothetical protein
LTPGYCEKDSDLLRKEPHYRLREMKSGSFWIERKFWLIWIKGPKQYSSKEQAIEVVRDEQQRYRERGNKKEVKRYHYLKG